jgi:hypothetical protein
MLRAGVSLAEDAPDLGRGREHYWRQVGTGFRYSVTDESSVAAAEALQTALDDVSGDV